MTRYKEEIKKLVLAALPLTLHFCNPWCDESDNKLILLKLYLKKIVKIGKKITKSNPEFLRIKQAINIFCKSSTTTNKWGKPQVPNFIDSFVEETYKYFCFKNSEEYFRKHSWSELNYYQFKNKGEESLEEYLTTHNKYNKVKKCLDY